MMKTILALLLALTSFALPTLAQESSELNLYAAPSGDSSLEAIFARPSTVRPGTTIWLRQGTYGNNGDRLISRLAGTKDRPIIIRALPGQRAIIEGGIISKGPHVWFWGFEITSHVSRSDNNRPSGLYLQGEGNKAINMIIHDAGHPGIGIWTEAGDGAEIYGGLIWNVGNNPGGEDNIVGSGIYAQNDSGLRYIRDVISFGNFTTGMKVYAEDGYVNNYHLEGNVAFNNGDRQIFASGGRNPVRNLTVINNFTYRAPEDNQEPVRMGYADTDQVNVTLKNNFFVNGNCPEGAFYIKRFRNIDLSGNTFVSNSNAITYLSPHSSDSVTWDNNHYYVPSADAFALDGHRLSFSEWQSRTKFDHQSTFTSSRPIGINLFVRPNLYEPNKANVVVYNWDKQSMVNLDSSYLTSLNLKPGDHYELRNVQDYFNDIISGVYDGNSIPLPMTGRSQVSFSAPNFTYHPTFPEFGVFVLTINP